MNTLQMIPRLVRRLTLNPALIREFLLYLKNDLLSLLGIYRYDFPIVFIAGLPKSGTTWLETRIALVPGYNLRPVNDSHGAARNHDISDDLFAALPSWGYSVLKLHTRYSVENLNVIQRHVPRFMVTIRDLRDMCISSYFHVKSDPAHPDHERYVRASLESGLMHRIEVTGSEYVPWLRDWLRIARQFPDTILLIRYEDLNRDPYASFKRVFEFFHLPLDEVLLRELERSKLSEERDIKVELTGNVGRRTRSTARKGLVGDWKNYFSDAHKARLKELTGDVMIEAGYESDLTW